MSLRRVLPSRANSPSGAEGAAPAPKTEINAPPVTPTPAPDTTPPPATSNSAALAMFAEPIAATVKVPDVVAAPAPTYANLPDPIAAEPLMPTAEVTPAAPAPAPVAPPTPENLTPSLPTEGMARRQFRAKEPRQFQQPAPEPEPQALIPSVPTPRAEDSVTQVTQRLSEAGLTSTTQADELTAALPPAPVAEVAAPTPEDAPTLPPLPTINIPAASVAVSNVVPLVSAPTTPSYQAPTTGLQATTSDLPWANPTVPADDANSGWNINFPTTPSAAEGSAQPAPAAQPTDLFSPAALSSTIQAAPRQAPPEIMASSKRQSGPLTTPSGGGWQLMAAAAVVAAVIGGAYWFVSGQAQAPQLALGVPTAPPVAPTPTPDPTAPLGLLPPPDPATANAMAIATATTTPSSSAIIAFTDVPPAEAGQPIVADSTQKMPEDVSFIANLQQAIAAEKGKRDIGTALGAAEATTPNALPTDPIARLEQGEDLKKQLDAELAAYREALANTPKPLAPKPTEFFEQQKGFMNGAPATAEANPNTVGTPPALDNEGAPLPPPTASSEVAQDGTLPPPNELYADNPAALPIVGQPTSAEAPRVRQLNDFNVAMFEPEKDKIRIPQGVKPKFSTSDFPSMEVLSFVPGKGLIAYKDGKEGVLLMGEELEGWQLVAVSTDVAEFRNGRRTQYVSAE